MSRGVSFVFFLVICLAVELLGGFWTSQSVIDWYPTLHKPSWTPPSWVFAPVWTILYVLIALAGWLLYQAPSSSKRTRSLIFYGIQLFFNLIWSFLFFGKQSLLLGLIDIALLWGFVWLTILQAWQVRKLASLLLIPYLVWITYAAALNISIWFLNR